jgi:hypothetical protein
MADSEKITVSKKYLPSDFGQMVRDVILQIPFKMMFIIFVVYFLLHTDVFINRIMAKIPGAVPFNDTLSTYGTILVGILLVFMYAVFNVLVENGIL